MAFRAAALKPRPGQNTNGARAPVSRKNILIAAVAAALVIAAGIGAYFLWGRDGAPRTASTAQEALNSSFPVPSGPPGALPDPVILVMDRTAILTRTKVGQDINRQMQSFTNQARDRLSGQQRSLQNDVEALQKAADMPEAERAKRIQSLQAREQSYAAASAKEEQRLRTTIAAAHAEVAKVMGPIMEQIVQRHGANMVLDRAAVPVVEGAGFDITEEVVKELDAKMPSYQVTLK